MKGGDSVENGTKRLAVSALLVAADVVLTRLLAINTPVMKIGLGFAAVALCALLYGPWWAAVTAALGDLLGALLFPTGVYFPGFTLTAALTGVIYGLCLYQKPARWVYPALAALLNTMLVSYLANTAMICIITGNSYAAMLAARAVQLAVMLPVQFLVLGWLCRAGLAEKLTGRPVK
jgi:ECF transporter S component (folate family)